jgi:anti-anti-sigma regulatory factor
MANTRQSAVMDNTAADSRRRSDLSAAFGKGDRATVGYGTSIQIRVIWGEGVPVALLLRGELDITSMWPFEQALALVMAESPPGLLFDLTECQFVSAQGYAAMGRCSAATSVEVRSRTDIASRIFTIFGYDRVVSVTL